MSDFVRKSLWLATNFAGKMIRETGYKNKAVATAAKYYNEVEADILTQLSIRQSKGQTGKKRGKMKSFVFDGMINIGYRGDIQSQVQKHFEFNALNKNNAIKRLTTKFEKEYGDLLMASETMRYFDSFQDIDNDLKECE